MSKLSLGGYIFSASGDTTFSLGFTLGDFDFFSSGDTSLSASFSRARTKRLGCADTRSIGKYEQ